MARSTVWNGRRHDRHRRSRTTTGPVGRRCPTTRLSLDPQCGHGTARRLIAHPAAGPGCSAPTARAHRPACRRPARATAPTSAPAQRGHARGTPRATQAQPTSSPDTAPARAGRRTSTPDPDVSRRPPLAKRALPARRLPHARHHVARVTPHRRGLPLVITPAVARVARPQPTPPAIATRLTHRPVPSSGWPPAAPAPPAAGATSGSSPNTRSAPPRARPPAPSHYRRSPRSRSRANARSP